MTAASEKSLGSLRLLIADPWRKLASIGLAIGLWFILDSQIADSVAHRLAIQTVDSADEFTQSNSLRVAVDSARFFVTGYFDRVTGDPISEVKIHLHGQKHLIADANENQSYLFTASLDAIEGETASIEFTIDDVRPSEQKFRQLMTRMEPASVRIDLAENERTPMALAIEKVEIDAPASIRARLLTESASFSEPSVNLVGPSNQIDAIQSASPLFTVRIAENPTAREVKGTLQLYQNNPAFDRVRFAAGEGDIIVTIPVTAEFEKYVLQVPYLLDTLALDPTIRENFRAMEREVRIEIQVANDLEIALSGMTTEERQAWIREYARLWVLLPPEAEHLKVGDKPLYYPHFEIAVPVYEDGVDYKVLAPKPVRVERFQ